MCAKVLEEMEGKTDRRARYVSVVALVYPDGKTKTFRGECYGTLTHERVGTEGFGYDPIFKPLEADCSFAEMLPEQKNAISHRGRAVKKLFEFFKNIDYIDLITVGVAKVEEARQDFSLLKEF